MADERRPLTGSPISLVSSAPMGGRGIGGGGGGGTVGGGEWQNGIPGPGVENSSTSPPNRWGNGYRAVPTTRGDPETGLLQTDGNPYHSANDASSDCVRPVPWRRESASAAVHTGPYDFPDEPTSVAADAKSSEAAASAVDGNEMNFPRVPSHQRVSVVFENLEVSSASFFSKEKKILLDGVSGQFRAGELVAVMGPSGAGKTTLLNTISGFSSGMKTGGTLRLQHEDGSLCKKRRAVCYLTQEDHVEPLLTARETVMHAADLKVGSRLSRKARGLLVDDILETLGLASCSYTRASQLSGGQRKRLALASELVDNPSVIFLDEPTSGLDMSTATQCTQLFRRIARSGRAVICTIHQPSENMLNMFDQIYLLAKGNCTYRGPPSQILPFLSSLGFQCPQYHNPADFMLEVANNEYGDALSAMKDEVEYRSSEYPPPLLEIKNIQANGKMNGKSGKIQQIEALTSVDNYQPSEWERFRVLVTRNLLLQHRDWVTTNIKLFATILTYLMIGLMFGPIGNNADRIMSNISFFFTIVLYTCYTPEAPAVMKYAEEIQVVKREWFNNWYSLYTYAFALLISSLPMHVMLSTIGCSIGYYMTGQLAEPLRFAHVTITLILTSLAAESLGLQFGSLFLKKKIISLFIASTHLAYLILFSGFVALKPEMPMWFSWATTINHMHYSLNSVVLATYQGRGRLNCPEDVVYCHFREPNSVLSLFGLAESELWHNLLALVIFIIVLRLTGFISLNYNVKRVNV